MTVHTEEVRFKTSGEVELVNITDRVTRVVSDSGIKDGFANIFAVGATGAITTIEYEPGLIKDLPTALERLFPKGIEYEHHKTWHDGNGHSHIRASFIGPSLTVPVKNGKVVLGTWQQIVFLELDVRPRDRRVVVTVVGE